MNFFLHAAQGRFFIGVPPSLPTPEDAPAAAAATQNSQNCSAASVSAAVNSVSGSACS